MRAERSSAGVCLFLILSVTILLFAPCLRNSFSFWDEQGLLLENPLIQEISFHNIQKIFTSPLEGRYYPLSILSYQLEYHFFGLKAPICHLTNLVLHLFNIILVFYLLRLLGLNLTVTALTVFLFAIHPLQVESVAWIAARKDVLSAFFFLGALISYVRAQKEAVFQKRFYLLSLGLFILSALAKPMAVTFPVVLLLADYFLRHKITSKDIINKTPFFCVALVFGFIALRSADLVQGFPAAKFFTFFDKIMFSAYALCVYLGKLIVPYRLSCLYPFPAPGNSLYLLLSFLAVILIVYFLAKKNTCPPKLKAAFLFFLIMIFPVLHLIKANTSLIYERFVYIPSIGVFLIIAAGWDYGVNARFKANPQIKSAIILGAVIYAAFLSFSTWSRCHVWENNETLWADAVYKFPDYAPVYIHRGEGYRREGQYGLALKDFNKAVELNPSSGAGYLNRASIYAITQRHDLAIDDYTRSLKFSFNDPRDIVRACNNRGLLYAFQGKYLEARADYDKALEIEPLNVTARLNRGIAYYKEEKFENALEDFSIILERHPRHGFAQYMRGVIQDGMNNEE